MKNYSTQFIILLFSSLLGAVFAFPSSLYAVETYTFGTVMTTATFRFNNENWFTEPHPKVASFSVTHEGNVTGYTETGIPFTQDTIPNQYGIRVQRFSIQDHYHYIINGEVVYTTEELSQKLARAQQTISFDSPQV